VTEQSIERKVREQLCSKVSTTHTGLWLLVPELQQLSGWEMLTNLFEKDLDRRIGLQLINEAALGVKRLRAKGSLSNQGFSLASGLPFLATDESVHLLLNQHSVADYSELQKSLLQIRSLEGHYNQNAIYALDPHRIKSQTKRITAVKKKKPDQPGTKVLQTFFCVDAISGQPLGFTCASSSKTCSSATTELMEFLKIAGVKDGLFIADKEHFTQEIGAWFCANPDYEILMPVPLTHKTRMLIKNLVYKRLWAGFAIAETRFNFEGSSHNYRLIAQRQGEDEGRYQYSAFLTTSCKDATTLITSNYVQRWTVEEFFNFEQALGWNNASTLNLNIKYGKQSMALLAQAALFGLRKKLPGEYQKYNAESMANKILTNLEGDIRVEDDNIVVTYYGGHEKLNLKNNYSNIENKLTNKNIKPNIPWLYDLKLKFRFK
jgi:hypothetical protein